MGRGQSEAGSSSRQKQKKYADRKRREVQYDVGDSVYLSTRNLQTYGGKLLAKWVGPYLVTEVRDGGVSVKLDLRGELGKTNPCSTSAS